LDFADWDRIINAVMMKLDTANETKRTAKREGQRCYYADADASAILQSDLARLRIAWREESSA
jgi:hypothetical protein